MELKKETAKRLYSLVPDWFQKELENEFGKAALKKRDYTDIKSFQDACDELGISTAQFSGAETPDEIAYIKLKIIIKAINQGWTPDWNNSNQYKWYPWFNLSSGFGFSNTHYYYDSTYTSVGSRLCFESDEKAKYAGKQFIEIYKDFLT